MELDQAIELVHFSIIKMQEQIENIKKERYDDVKIVRHHVDSEIEANIKAIDNMNILSNLKDMPDLRSIR